MRNAGLKETQAGIKIAGRNINNLRYADDTTFMADSSRVVHGMTGHLSSCMWNLRFWGTMHRGTFNPLASPGPYRLLLSTKQPEGSWKNANLVILSTSSTPPLLWHLG